MQRPIFGGSMKKGFSLVELIISIILITAISVASLFIYLKNKEDNEVITAMKELEEVSNIFYSDNFSSGDYKYYKNDEGSTVSCMKLETLVNEGLVDSDSPLFKTYGLDNIFKYIVNSEGFVSIEPVIDATDKTCEYISMEEEGLEEIVDEDEDVDKYGVEVKDEDNNKWRATYDYSFINGTDSDFKGNIVFNMALTQEITKETINPLYIVIVLDSSGSMAGTRYNKALAGINNLINTLKSEVSGGAIKLAAVSFYDYSKKHNTNFINLSSISNYSSLSFPSSPIREMTNCAAGLDDAKEYFDLVTDPKAVKIAIFLADGMCNEPSWSTGGTYAISSASTLKNNNIQIFTIGYELSSEYKPTMEDIASSSNVCDLGKYEEEKICYFDSTTADIGSTFSKLAKSSIQASIENPYNKVTFTIKLADYFSFLEGSIDTTVHNEEGYRYQDSIDLENNTLTRTITIYDTEKVNALKVTNFDYKVNFLADQYKKSMIDAGVDIEVGTSKPKTLDILSSFQILMEGSEIPNKNINIEENLPKITVDLLNNSVVN